LRRKIQQACGDLADRVDLGRAVALVHESSGGKRELPPRRMPIQTLASRARASMAMTRSFSITAIPFDGSKLSRDHFGRNTSRHSDGEMDA